MTLDTNRTYYDLFMPSDIQFNKCARKVLFLVAAKNGLKLVKASVSRPEILRPLFQWAVHKMFELRRDVF